MFLKSAKMFIEIINIMIIVTAFILSSGVEYSLIDSGIKLLYSDIKMEMEFDEKLHVLNIDVAFEKPRGIGIWDSVTVTVGELSTDDSIPVDLNEIQDQKVMGNFEVQWNSVAVPVGELSIVDTMPYDLDGNEEVEGTWNSVNGPVGELDADYSIPVNLEGDKNEPVLTLKLILLVVGLVMTVSVLGKFNLYRNTITTLEFNQVYEFTSSIIINEEAEIDPVPIKTVITDNGLDTIIYKMSQLSLSVISLNSIASKKQKDANSLQKDIDVISSSFCLRPLSSIKHDKLDTLQVVELKTQAKDAEEVSNKLRVSSINTKQEVEPPDTDLKNILDTAYDSVMDEIINKLKHLVLTNECSFDDCPIKELDYMDTDSDISYTDTESMMDIDEDEISMMQEDMDIEGPDLMMDQPDEMKDHDMNDQEMEECDMEDSDMNDDINCDKSVVADPVFHCAPDYQHAQQIEFEKFSFDGSDRGSGRSERKYNQEEESYFEELGL